MDCLAVVLLLLYGRWLVITVLGVLEMRRAVHRDAVREDALVTVIVPAFNEARVLPELLDSLLRCSYGMKEIVVVDDGSTDGTAAVAEAYRARFARFKVLVHSRNRGKAAALNTGIAAATGSFMATIDADTQVRPDTLSRAIARLREARADAVACHIGLSRRDALLQEIQEIEYHASLNVERAAQSRIRAISVLPGAGSVYRAEVLRAQPFSCRTATEDADSTLSLGARGCVIEYAGDAVVDTHPPRTCAELLTQRVRWATGHLQCIAYHACGTSRVSRFMLLTFPNFAFSSFAALTAFMVGVCVAMYGAIVGSVRIDALDLLLTSLALIYLQRFCVLFGTRAVRPRLRAFLLEPLIMPLVHGWAIGCSAGKLLMLRERHARWRPRRSCPARSQPGPSRL